MNLFQNNLKQLQKENDRNLASVQSLQNKNEISHMLDYLSVSKLSVFQVEVVRKDIIAMALEADRENKTISEKLGIDTKDFCCDIIKNNSEYPARGEHIILELAPVIYFLTAFYALEFIFMNSAPVNWGISGFLLVTVVLYFIFTRCCSLMVKNKLSMHQKHYIRRLYIAVMVTGIIIYAASAKALMRNENIFIVNGNGWLIFLVLVIISIVTFFATNLYWNHCSEKYNY